MSKWLSNIFLAIILVTPLFSQIQLKILAIAGQAVSHKSHIVDNTAEIAGSLYSQGALEQDLMVLLAWRRSNEETWWIDKNRQLFAAGSRGRQVWRFPVVALGGEFDFRKSLQLMAIAIPVDRPVAEGIIDYHSLIFLGEALSRPVNLRRKARVHETFRVNPRIRIDHISDRPMIAGQIQEVGLQEIFGGQVRKPTLSRLRLVIQPMESGDYWVMADEPLFRDGFWSAKADFVENGFDAYTDFTVLAVIARKDLPLGRAINRSEWRRLLGKDIIGISPLTQVQRIAVPPARNSIAIRILSVDEQPVSARERREVRLKSGIKGMVSGRVLDPGESVWVLISRQYSADKWQILGEASIKDGRYWELTPINLGPAGTFLKLIAVVAVKQGDQMLVADIEKNLAYSKPIHIKTSETPPLLVNIRRIDQQQIVADADEKITSLEVSRVSRVEGTLGGRNVEKNDQVWILRMSRDQQDSWELIGQASLRNEREWVLPPLTLGESGERIFLMAVVAPQKIERLDISEQSRVVASSPRIRLLLQ